MPLPHDATRQLAKERTTTPRARAMAFPRLLSLPPHVISTAFVVAYVGLEWISFVHPFRSFGITPWNPGMGLSFVVILLFGQRHMPMLFVAPLLADLFVRGTPASPVAMVLSSAVIAGGSALALRFLLRPALRFDVSLSSQRDLFLLLLVAAVSAAAVSAGFVGIYCAAGLLSWEEFWPAGLRYWVGDVIGVAVLTPALLIVLTRGQPFVASWETLAQVLAIVTCLAIVFGSGQSKHLQLFYLLFLPIIWIAVRSGLEGVSAGLVLTQIGLMIALVNQSKEDLDLTAFQALMLVLSFTGLAAGVLVTERRRAELQLRLQQDVQAKLTRLGSMGELATVLAHEINQPLMAAGTYSRMAARSIAAGDGPDKAGETAAKAVAQIERAAQVVRRLRELIRLGRSELAPVSVSRLVSDTLELLRPDIERSNVRIEQRLPPNLPAVLVDALQIEQVLLNLVRNAIEAIRDGAVDRGVVTIRAAIVQPGQVQIEVLDNGPGFPEDRASGAHAPFDTSKADGLGVGLSLSRSIVDAHGGHMHIANTETGACVRFTLPAAETMP